MPAGTSLIWITEVTAEGKSHGNAVSWVLFLHVYTIAQKWCPCLLALNTLLWNCYNICSFWQVNFCVGTGKNKHVWEHEEQSTSIYKPSTLLWCHPLALFSSSARQKTMSLTQNTTQFFSSIKRKRVCSRFALPSRRKESIRCACIELLWVSEIWTNELQCKTWCGPTEGTRIQLSKHCKLLCINDYSCSVWKDLLAVFRRNEKLQSCILSRQEVLEAPLGLLWSWKLFFPLLI